MATLDETSGDEHANNESGSALEQRNSRYGLVLFAIYLVLYGSFMAINVANPAAMARPVLAGLNLAVVYGFALIVSALVLALVYMALCRRNEESAR